MTQEELLKALKGGGGREQVNFDLGQVGLRPTIQRGGQYNVQVQQAPQTNPALQLAEVFKDSSKLLNNFVDIQTKQGEIEANALTPEEVIKRVEQGDPNAGSFLDKLGKEKTFVETTYKRYYNSTVQPQLTGLAEELKNRPVHEYADQGITTPEDFKAYAEERVKELTDQFSKYADKSPYAQSIHNQLIEEVVPDLVQRQVSNFDAGITKFNKDEAIANLPILGPDNGVSLEPPTGKARSFNEQPRGTIYGWEKPGEPTYDENSSKGIGANASTDEQNEILTGKVNDAKLVANQDFALSPDLQEQLEAQGFKLRDMVTLTMEDGTTHTGRWMDVTAKEYKEKTLSGRVDIYSPNKDSPLNDKKFTGFSRSAEDETKKFNEGLNNVISAGDQSLANAQFSPTERAKILRANLETQIKTLSTGGRFAEARKILGALNSVKIGDQPLFGSVDGRATFVGLEDLVDREEDQFSAENSRDEEKRNKDLSAEYEIKALREINAGKNYDEVFEKQTADVLAREDLTDYQRSSIIKSLYQAQNQQYAANIKASSVVEDTIKAYGLGDQVVKTAVVANTPSDAFEYMSLNFPKETLDTIITQDLSGKPSIKPGAVQLLSQTIQQAQYSTEEALQTVAQGLRVNNELEYGGVKYNVSTPALKRETGAKLATIINDQFKENIKAAFTNNINSSQFKQAVSQTVSDEEQALFDAKLVKFGGDAKLARVDLENDKRKANQETSVVNADGTVRVGVGLFESAYDYATKANNSLTKGLIKNSKGEVDAAKSYEVFSSAKASVHNSQWFPYDLDDYYAAPLGSEQQAKAVRNVRRSFQEVGFPVDAIQSGFIQKTFTKLGTSETRNVLFSIEEDLKNKEAYKTLPIIPAHWLQKRDEPVYATAIKKFSSKWGISETQIADQETLYQSRGIKVTK